MRKPVPLHSAFRFPLLEFSSFTLNMSDRSKTKMVHRYLEARQRRLVRVCCARYKQAILSEGLKIEGDFSHVAFDSEG
jgi:hypothetical protein